MELGGNDVMAAFGIEYREESISDNPDDQFLRGDVFGTEATQANGERDSTALFTEVAVPVTDDLELQLALRYEDYSDFGTTTDPKVSFLWSPTDKLSFRGSWGTAFRAPSLHQLGLGRTDESPNLVDTIRCAAVGLACDPQEYTAIFAGNPNLGPEESTSYNLGMIYEITDDLSFSLDYYNYDIENIIDSDTQFVFSNFGADPSVVTRLPTSDPNDPGEVVEIFDSFQNIGDLETSGLDLDLSYNLSTGFGEVRLGYVLNYVLEYEELRPDATGGSRVALSEGQFEQPEVRWTTTADWSKDDWAATVAINYIGEFDGDADSGFGDKTVDSMTTVDLTVSYTGLDNATFTLGSTNLFNEEPPYSHHDFFGFVNTVHSSQGRFVYVRGAYKF
jgi:outer membrane receptor protein involved in Fe transport